MKRNLLFAIALLALTAAWVTACGGQSARAKTADPTSTSVPVVETSPEDTGEQTSVFVSHGGPVEDYVSLIDNLRASGATVEPVGEVEQAFFSVTSQVITVNGNDVQVFEYADAEAAEADAALVAPDGGSVGTTMVTWVATPHFYQTGKLIVLYVGDDSGVTEVLETVLGPQFAGTISIITEYDGIALPPPRSTMVGAPPLAWLMVNHEAFPATYAAYTTALAHADPAEKMPELPAVTLPANSTVTILIASEVVTQAQVTARPWSADGSIVPLFDPADIELKTQAGRDGTLTTLTLESTLLEGDQLLHLFITFPIAFPFATPISGTGEAHYLWRLTATNP